MLLALDNFEHVLAAAPLVARLLDSCPRLKLLVTSRAVLRVAAEHDVLVPPLPVPAARASATQALQTPAVRLFVERARATGHAVGEQPAEVAAAADICRRLDGLPLAIELAAARLRVLTPVALAQRLGSRLTLLKGGASDLPQRQKTLRDAIAWSYELLDADEQRLFRRLAVFVGGWTLEAAEAIARASGLEQSVLDLLSSLIDHNLVQRTEDVGDESRFTMLETVREFAAELFESSGESDAAARASCRLLRRLRRKDRAATEERRTSAMARVHEGRVQQLARRAGLGRHRKTGYRHGVASDGRASLVLVLRRTVRRGTRLDQPCACIAGCRSANRRPREGAVGGGPSGNLLGRRPRSDRIGNRERGLVSCRGRSCRTGRRAAPSRAAQDTSARPRERLLMPRGGRRMLPRAWRRVGNRACRDLPWSGARFSVRASRTRRACC